jgi:threonine/homoserine/homoserine lactone efflux protein
MINPDLFLAFCITAAAVVIIPGPVVTLVVANALGHGRRAGLMTVFGALVGTAILIGFGAIGLTTVLTLMADIFEWVRWIGVAWLVWLAWKFWRAAIWPPEASGEAPAPATRNLFWQGFVVGFTNPKSVVFYVAFFPQFIDPAISVAPQLLVLSLAFLAIAVVLDSGYALLAGQLRPWLVSRRLARIRNGVSGTLLLGVSLGLALARRQA